MGDAVLEVVADDDHVAHAHPAGEEQGPHAAHQPGIPDHQIGGDQPAAEVHGEHEEQTDPLPPRQILLGQGIGGDVEHHHGEDGADDGVFHRIEEAGDDLRVCEHRLIAVKGEAAGQQEGLPCIHVVGVGEGGYEDIVQRVGHDQQDYSADGHQDDIAGLVGHTGRF